MNEAERQSPRVRALIRPGERLDDLMREGMMILQRPEGFCFGMDSVLLAAFAAERAGSIRAVDLGTGSGILPLLICSRQPGGTFDAVELQPDVADMASRSVTLCGMEERIRVYAMDLRATPGRLGFGKYRLAVCNPPYNPLEGALKNPLPARSIARHEGAANIAEICMTAGSLLLNGGRFCLIFPAPRLLELMDAMRGAGIEPKRIRLVHPKVGRAPNLALVEGIRGSRPMLHFLPPLFVRDENGKETEDLRGMYR